MRMLWNFHRHVLRGWGRRLESQAQTTQTAEPGSKQRSLKSRIITGSFGAIVVGYVAVKAYRVMVYMPHALPSNSQLWHAWLASQAACFENPAEFLNRPYIRPLHSFFCAAPASFDDRRVQVAWCETKEDVYIGIAGPMQQKQQPATELIRTNALPPISKDLTGAECCHTNLPRYAAHLPLNSIYDMVFLQSKPLVLCGHGMGGAIAHACLLSNLFGNTHGVSPYFAKVRSIAFGSPYICTERLRKYTQVRNWHHMFVNVVANNDPVPFVLSALMDPSLRELPPKERNLFTNFEKTLNKLLGDPESGITDKSRQARQKIEVQATKEYQALRTLLPKEKADYKHFKPIGRWCFVKAGNVEEGAESNMVESKVDIRKEVEKRRIWDQPVFADHSKRSYFQTLTDACGIKPALELQSPVLLVEWPFLRKPGEVAVLDPVNPGLLRSSVPPAVQHYQRETPSSRPAK